MCIYYVASKYKEKCLTLLFASDSYLLSLSGTIYAGLFQINALSKGHLRFGKRSNLTVKSGYMSIIISDVTQSSALYTPYVYYPASGESFAGRGNNIALKTIVHYMENRR